MVDDFNIRSLRPEEWKLLRQIRLEALKLHPNYYASNYDDTAKITEVEWRMRLSSALSCIFGLFKAGEIIGITGIYVREDTPYAARLVMSYIKPEYRKKNLSKLLYEARIDWTIKQKNLKIIKVSHRIDNIASKRAIHSHGFIFKDQEKIKWPDGAEDFELKYELDLQQLRT